MRAIDLMYLRHEEMISACVVGNSSGNVLMVG